MSNSINTYPVQKFSKTVIHADLTQQKTISLDIKTAKTLALTIAEMATKINQDYESLISKIQNPNNEILEIKLDGGGFKKS